VFAIIASEQLKDERGTDNLNLLETRQTISLVSNSLNSQNTELAPEDSDPSSMSEYLILENE
ncbi:19703_t:CDS:2, partial [Gigaspora margarita]